MYGPVPARWSIDKLGFGAGSELFQKDSSIVVLKERVYCTKQHLRLRKAEMEQSGE
jgi:hypothetical protein